MRSQALNAIYSGEEGRFGVAAAGIRGSDESLIWRDLPLAATLNGAARRAMSYLCLIAAQIDRRSLATLR